MNRTRVLELSMDVVRNRPASGLTDLLILVNPDVSHWRLTDFYGTSFEDSGINVMALESSVRGAGDLGLGLSNAELTTLLAGLDQIFDCELYGFHGAAGSIGLEDAVVLIRALDSTKWEVEVGEQWRGGAPA